MGKPDIYCCSSLGNEVMFHGIKADVMFDAAKPLFKCHGIYDLYFNAAMVKERLEKVFLRFNFKFPPCVKICFSSSSTIRYPVFCDLAIGIAILSEQFDFGLSGKTLVLRGFSGDGSGSLISERIAVAAVQEAVRNGFSNIICDDRTFLSVRKYSDGVTIVSGNSIREIKDRLVQMNDSTISFSDSLGTESDMTFSNYFRDCDPGTIRALSIAAAGRHNILLAGGKKSLKAVYINNFMRRFLPNLTMSEARETERLCSLADGIGFGGITGHPFVELDKFDSFDKVVGGGRFCRPGKVSIAHNGVLFLNEYTRYSNSVIRSLSSTLGNHCASVGNPGKLLDIPCDYQLAVSMSPCKCGNLGCSDQICTCSRNKVELFYEKLNPVSEYMDISWIIGHRRGDSGGLYQVSLEDIREDVSKAFAIQRSRGVYNARLDGDELDGIVKFSSNVADRSLPAAVKKVSLTIANMDGRNEVCQEDIREAMEVCVPIRERVLKIKDEQLENVSSMADALVGRLCVRDRRDSSGKKKSGIACRDVMQ